MQFRDAVVLVVGASSGIGRAVALRLAGQGAVVAAVARRADRLATLAEEIEAAGGRCRIYAADVSDATKALLTADVSQHRDQPMLA